MRGWERRSGLPGIDRCDPSCWQWNWSCYRNAPTFLHKCLRLGTVEWGFFGLLTMGLSSSGVPHSGVWRIGAENQASPLFFGSRRICLVEGFLDAFPASQGQPQEQSTQLTCLGCPGWFYFSLSLLKCKPLRVDFFFFFNFLEYPQCLERVWDTVCAQLIILGKDVTN